MLIAAFERRTMTEQQINNLTDQEIRDEIKKIFEISEENEELPFEIAETFNNLRDEVLIRFLLQE